MRNIGTVYYMEFFLPKNPSTLSLLTLKIGYFEDLAPAMKGSNPCIGGLNDP